MAPEYMVRGKLTEKVDVYSFGVLVIEVVLGTKNYALSLNSHSILQKVLCCILCQTCFEVFINSFFGIFQ